MCNYILSTCSVCDLTPEYCREKNIEYACFRFSINGQYFKDDMGITMSAEKFYSTIKGRNVDVKTSQVNVDEFLEYFKPFLESGKDVFHVSMSTGLSGSYNSACIAANELSKIYPKRKIYVVDSLSASSGLGLIVDRAANMRDSGYSIDELKNWFEENKLRLNHWFTTTDLSFFVRGGRISKVAGFMGGILKICPILNVDFEGHLTPREKVRTTQKALLNLLEHMIDNAEGGLEYSGKCFISNSDCFEDARKLADMIEAKFKNLEGKVEIFNIGTTIGSHTGPGTVALFFWGDKKRV